MSSNPLPFSSREYNKTIKKRPVWNEGEEEEALLAEARAAMGIDDSAKGEDDGLEDTFLQVSEGPFTNPTMS